jgi:hypothetical protein
MRIRFSLLEVLLGLVLVGCIGFALVSFASQSVIVDVRASIPQVHNLSVAISKAPAAGGNWTPASSVDFGQLYFDNTWRIFRSNWYYAVDVGALSNMDWTLTHTRTSILNAGSGATLDNNTNVAFTSSNGTGDVRMDYVSYQNSQNMAYARSRFTPGRWLRIYYGIATGNVSEDAPGVVAVGIDKPVGAYQGTATLTLSP